MSAHSIPCLSGLHNSIKWMMMMRSQMNVLRALCQRSSYPFRDRAQGICPLWLIPWESNVIMNSIWAFAVGDLAVAIPFSHINYHFVFQSDYAVVKFLCTTSNDEG